MTDLSNFKLIIKLIDVCIDWDGGIAKPSIFIIKYDKN